MLYRLFRAMAMLESGSVCRRCGVGIAESDHVGVSESVCAPCRA